MTRGDFGCAVDAFATARAGEAAEIFTRGATALGLHPHAEGSEQHSKCPYCGGNGSRFVLLERTRGGGPPFAWCRQCRRGLSLADLATAARVGQLPQPSDVALTLRDAGLLGSAPLGRSRPRPASTPAPTCEQDARLLGVALALVPRLTVEQAEKLLRIDRDRLRAATSALRVDGNVFVSKLGDVVVLEAAR